ncbi:MAG: GAF domain-containing sensor histidine kinase [Candidatus Pacebacteria bacterium]|nr:GAF domain-containing sensor histidine kinase [Candidatus Paceibacterota bacterium]
MHTYSVSLAQKIPEEQQARNQAQELVNKLQKAEEQIKLQLTDLSEKNRVLAALRRLNLIIMESLEMESLCQKIVDTLSVELKCSFGLIGIIDETRNRFYFKAINKDSRLARLFRQKHIKIEESYLSLEEKNNSINQSISLKKKISAKKIADILCPLFPRKKLQGWQKIVKISTCRIYPIISKTNVLGAMVFGWKKAKHKISPEEKDLMKNVIDQTSIALDNTILYQKLKRSVSQLKQANLKLQDLDRMKNEFVSIASHELRTPMTSVNNYIWMVLRGKGGQITTRQRFYLDRAATSTQRLINLVEDMLTVSRIEGGKLEINLKPGSILKIGKNVIEELKPKAREKKIKLFLELPKKELPLALIDQEKIKEVFINLVDNALKFTPVGGQVKVTFNLKGKMILIQITDTGRGIPKNDIPKLFKKFGRLDRSFVTIAETGGTGLGLYICKQIIDLHRGRIGVRSIPDKGSCFYFNIKIAEEVKK